MCIRDSTHSQWGQQGAVHVLLKTHAAEGLHHRAKQWETQVGVCLLYTSDAADERSSVDLGGRRIIKKKKHIWVTRLWTY